MGGFEFRLSEMQKSKLPQHWKKIYDCAEKLAAEACNQLDKNIEYLYDEYIHWESVRRKSMKELLTLPDIVTLTFFVQKYLEKGYTGQRPKQIIAKKENPAWMHERDYCFFNIRAVGEDVAETGNIIDATKLLPVLRVSGIHIAPFFECDYGIIYCQNSFYRINHEIVNQKYLKAGVTAEEQMQFFLDCCHILDKAVGFDVTPHTSWISPLRLDRPECFRWVRLNQEKTGLYDDMSIDEQYEDTYQIECQKQIKKIVKSYKEKYGLTLLDTSEENALVPIKEMNQAVFDGGYYSVPPHTWNGLCVPGYKKFAYSQDMPIWDYRDAFGNDQGQHAIFLHSNFYMHKGMRANQMPSQLTGDTTIKPVEKNEDVIAFFTSYIAENVEKYLFDYVRVDYVDHIFNNIKETEEGQIPLNEMFTPQEMLEITKSLQERWHGLGFQADHLGFDAVQFGKAGFNLITGGEVWLEFNRENEKIIFEHFIRQDEIGNSLSRSNWAIDTHDMAHPLFLGKELIHREGQVGLLVRMCLSRFANVGAYRRAKYEVIGNQDASYGIHRANNRAESLTWGQDKIVQQAYHAIEDVYESLKLDLVKCHMKQYSIGKRNVCFCLEHTEQKKQYIGVVPIPIVEGKKCCEAIQGENVPDTFQIQAADRKSFHCMFATSVFQLDFQENIVPSDWLQIEEQDMQLELQVEHAGFLLLEMS